MPRTICPVVELNPATSKRLLLSLTVHNHKIQHRPTNAGPVGGRACVGSVCLCRIGLTARGVAGVPIQRQDLIPALELRPPLSITMLSACPSTGLGAQ